MTPEQCYIVALVVFLSGCSTASLDEVIYAKPACYPTMIPRATVYCHDSDRLLLIADVRDTGMECLK